MSLVDDTCDNCGGRFDPMGDPLLTKHPEIGPYAVFCAACETSVPPTQPPAAPETDVRLTEAEKSYGRTDPSMQWRGRWYSEASVERIVAERVRVVEGERDAAKADRHRLMRAAGHDLDQACSRAESAEAAHHALVGFARDFYAHNADLLSDYWRTEFARALPSTTDAGGEER